MKNVDNLLFRALGLMITFLVLSGPVLAQLPPDSIKTVAVTANLNNTQVSQDSNPLITLKVDRVSLREALKRIAGQAEAGLYYNAALLPDKTVSLRLQAVPLGKALRKVLAGTSLRVVTSGRNITLRPKRKKDKIQLKQANKQETIIGTVTDASTGDTMPGVNIKVKGTTTGTSTDAQGQYELTVESLQDTLVFSFVGYQTRQVPINGRTTINISLKSQAISGQELVVVGYGTQKEQNVTGSVSQVNIDDETVSRPITNSSQILEGTASGVWASQNSGDPGNDESQIRIRGWGTMNNANPLIIIDGVQGSFDQVDPHNIKSVTVLKDAASAAIYGSKAANGVILVTTKEGQYNKKMNVDISSYGGVQKLGERYNMVNNSAKYMKLWNQALTNEGGSPLYPDYLISEFDNNNDPYEYPNTNWYKELFRAAPIQNYNVSISGGSSKVSEFISLNYLKQKGIVKNTDSRKYGLRINVQVKPVKWFNLNVKLRYKNQDSNAPYYNPYNSASSGNPLQRTWAVFNAAVPFIAPYTKDGLFGSVQAIDKDGNLLYDNRNPLIDDNNGNTGTNDRITIGNLHGRVKLTNNLNLQSTFAVSDTRRLRSMWNQSLYGYTSTGKKSITKNYNRAGIARLRRYNETYLYSFHNTIHYSNNFGQAHDVSFVGGMQYESRTLKNVGGSSTNPAKENLTQVDAGTGGYQAIGTLLGVRTLSYFARFNYSLFNKYLIEGDFRRDASSRFGKGNRWGTFPGVSVGWRLGNEKFIRNLNIFSSLKLRASWGKLGNQNIAGYWPYLTVINQNNDLSYSYGGGFEAGAGITSLVNNNITWETTTQKEVGINAGFLENSLKINFNYFKKLTKDIIVQLPIPFTLGGPSPPYQNRGEMENNGFGLDVHYDIPSQNRDQFKANINANITYIHNEVTKFRDGNSPDQLYLIREGFPYRSLYGYHVIGIYQSDVAAAKDMKNNSSIPKAGNLKYQDVNNDGKLDFRDKQFLGRTIPKWTFGLSPKFNFKGFDLNILFSGSAGYKVNTQSPLTQVDSDNASINKMWENAWTPQNKNTDVPSIKLRNSWDNKQSDFWMSDISYVKMKNIQLGYTIPTSVSSRLGAQNIYVYANGKNVFTIVSKDYRGRGYNPERNTFGSGAQVYPTPKIFTVGFNLKF